jgi:hypothetical protein
MLPGVANTDQSARLALTSLMSHSTALSARGGIIPTPAGNELQVTANGTPNKTVNIAPGQCWVAGAASGAEGAYEWTLDAATTATIDDGYSSNARWDIVAVRIHPGTGTHGIVIVKGADTTGTPVPAFPSDGASYLELKRINVPALPARTPTEIRPGDLYDTGRTYTAATGGLIPVANGLRPSARFDGMPIIERPSGNEYRWNAAGTRWRRMLTEDDASAIGGVLVDAGAFSPATAITTATVTHQTINIPASAGRLAILNGALLKTPASATQFYLVTLTAGSFTMSFRVEAGVSTHADYLEHFEIPIGVVTAPVEASVQILGSVAGGSARARLWATT